MKQYDKIYVPAEGRSQTDYYMDREGDLVGLTELPNSIVLTLEELREFWNAGRQHLREAEKAERADEPELIVSPNFETYLTSKGIQIPNDKEEASAGGTQ